MLKILNKIALIAEYANEIFVHIEFKRLENSGRDKLLLQLDEILKRLRKIISSLESEG